MLPATTAAAAAERQKIKGLDGVYKQISCTDTQYPGDCKKVSKRDCHSRRASNVVFIHRRASNVVYFKKTHGIILRKLSCTRHEKNADKAISKDRQTQCRSAHDSRLV
jgi:hypothetical protein